MSEWKVMKNYIGGEVIFQAWRQTRPLNPGEPMSSEVREIKGAFATKEQAQAYADELNGMKKIEIKTVELKHGNPAYGTEFVMVEGKVFVNAYHIVNILFGMYKTQERFADGRFAAKDKWAGCAAATAEGIENSKDMVAHILECIKEQVVEEYQAQVKPIIKG